ncbi:MAG: glycosyltransferase family 39 protein [Gaiellaceae bacterium]
MRQAWNCLRTWLVRLASRPLGALLLFLAALGVYTVRALAWPLTAGRDLDEYVYAYAQLLDADPVLPWSLLFRTPVTPVVAGFSLDMFDGALAEPVMALLFAGSVVAWSAAARFFGPWVAIAVAVALLVYPAYGILFHALNSEPVFAAAFALWTLLLVRAVDRPSTARWASVGLGIALVALVRPGNAVLLVFALFPFVLPGTLRERVTRAAAVALAASLPLVAWSAHNGVRYDEWKLARGGNAVIPFYRAFITDRIVSPENGEASRRLGGAVQRHLLTREPYRSYGVTLDEVFTSGSFRIHEDLYLLSDEVFGWDTDYSVLREAGIEAVRAHPGAYARGVAKTVWLQLSESLFREVRGGAAQRPVETVDERADGLPPPSEGQPIPGGQVVWISRPDNAIRQVWASPTDFRFAFDDPSLRPRFDRVERRRDELFASFPDRTANAELALRLNQASRWFPRPVLFVVVGLLAIALRRPRGWPTLVALGFAGFLVVLLNALGLFADRHFILPVAPAFVLLGLGGLLATARSSSQPERTRP